MPLKKLAILVLAVPLAACEDDLFDLSWTVSPDTAAIYTLARPELGPPAGFDFLAREPVRIEAPGATGRWDVALDGQGSGLVLLPPGALGVRSAARLLLLADTSFDAVTEAPRDTTLYVRDRALPVKARAVYVVRTHEGGRFTGACAQYGKFTPVEIDTVVGALRFLYDVNPFCRDRRLVPPK